MQIASQSTWLWEMTEIEDKKWKPKEIQLTCSKIFKE